MKKTFFVAWAILLQYSLALADPLQGNAAAGGLWHRESIYYNELDIPFNPGGGYTNLEDYLNELAGTT